MTPIRHLTLITIAFCLLISSCCDCIIKGKEITVVQSEDDPEILVGEGLLFQILSDSACTAGVCGNTLDKDSCSVEVEIPAVIKHEGKKYTVTSIGTAAFASCSNLESVNLSKSLKEIGTQAFYNCSNLAAIEIPNSVTSIGDGAFERCYGLTSVDIPNSLTKIGKWMFCECYDLTSFKGKFTTTDGRCLIINGKLIAFAPAGLTTYSTSNSITSIGEFAFYRCYLTSVTISHSVRSIGMQAFAKCYKLKEIISLNPTPPSVEPYTDKEYVVDPDEDKLFFDVDKSTCVLKVPALAVEAYKASEVWGRFTNIIGLTPEEIQRLELKK